MRMGSAKRHFFVVFTLLLSLVCNSKCVENGDNDASRLLDHDKIKVLQSLSDYKKHVVSGEQNSPWIILCYHAPVSRSVSESFRSIAAMDLFSLAVIDSASSAAKDIEAAIKQGNAENLVPSFSLSAPGDLTFLILKQNQSVARSATFQSKDTGVELFSEEMMRKVGETIRDLLQSRHGFNDSKPKDDKKKKEFPNERNEKNKKRDTKEKSSSSSSTSGRVVIVTGKDYKDKVLNNPAISFVAFIAPWCGHCQKLQPEWESAARQLRNEPQAQLVWIDATQEQELAQRYKVQGYPTIKIFPGGLNKTHKDAQDYRGERQAGSIVQAVLQEVDRTGVPKEVPELTSQEMFMDECAGPNRLCVLAALPHISESGAAGRNKYRDLLARVAKTFRGSSSAFSFLWMEGTTQADLEQTLELTFGYPALVAISVERRAYAVLHGSFSEKAITAFLHSITTGRQPTIALSADKNFHVKSVSPWDGKDVEIVEDEMSLEEIMGEL